ncbi:hypothetical protein N7452_001057 [Penicillium brevicompactum]|uniref:Uncharacterized protein n=1 Tax=Penicillium brevicompactum TaxID=5074 RepID=A0A9W9R1L9_PENBR|nr:hypothetical protein N7452_001057 [Penicillium brevicompactum]
MQKSSLALLFQLIWAISALAENAITIPWVGYSYSGNYFAGYEGKIVGTDGDKTTYVVNCPPSDTTCIAFDSDNAMTVIAGSNSKYPIILKNAYTNNSAYDLIYTDPWEYTSSGCTFAGGPTPTTATCSYIQTIDLGGHSTSREDTYNVPASTVYREIYSATLAVAGSTSSSSTATKTGTSAVTQTSTGDVSSTTDNTVIAATASAAVAVSTTATSNLACKSSMPMIVVGGIIAGFAMNM